MQHKRKNYFLMTLLGIIFLFSIFFTTQTNAQSKAKDKYGLEGTAQKTVLSSLSLSKADPDVFILKIITYVFSLVSLVFFILILYAGVTWMIDMGSKEKITKSKNILQTAIIGLLIIIASYAITTFLFEKISSVPKKNKTCNGVCLPECPEGIGAGIGSCEEGQFCCANQ